MAKAAEGCAGAGGLEAELTCPICLGLYREPVSLSCGHNFCRRCIEEVLGTPHSPRGPSTCPICRAHLGPTAELRNNFKLGSIMEVYWATTSEGQRARRESLEQEEEGAESGEKGVVLCEHCLDGPQPAVKTCLVCEASLCQAHLSKHNAKGFHQEHVLVEVGAGRAEERRCGDHGKLLECYCLREETLICILCSIAGTHKGHAVVTMKEGHGTQMVKLSNTMEELQKSKSDFNTALEELWEREKQIKTYYKKLASQLEELFNGTEAELHERKTRILSDILSNEEKNLQVVADMRNKMEQKRDQAEENLQALQKIKEQPDVFLFFKDLKPVTDRIASLDLDTETVEVEEVEPDWRIVAQYERVEKQLLSQLDSLLEDVRGKLTNLNKAKKEQKSIVEEKQDRYYFNNVFMKSDYIKPIHKKDMIKRHRR
uniref:Uncharacterized protein n=1 Tax=Zosterops lateralis melanops TaxID=1220523 RepID=A0A8D2P876_ZOSLA